MLKDFWDQKKHLVQLVGILIGVGALFLSIPVPENEQARSALLNVQFIWLIIVTLSTAVLMFNLYLLVGNFERQAVRKGIIDLDDTFTAIVIAGIIYFIFNMWRYAAALYQDAFFDFFSGWAGYGMGALIGALGFYCFDRVEQRFRYSRVRSITAMLTVVALTSLVGSAWVLFIMNRGGFPISRWMLASSIVFVVLCGIPPSVYFYRRIKKFLEQRKSSHTQNHPSAH